MSQIGSEKRQTKQKTQNLKPLNNSKGENIDRIEISNRLPERGEYDHSQSTPKPTPQHKQTENEEKIGTVEKTPIACLFIFCKSKKYAAHEKNKNKELKAKNKNVTIRER